MPDVPPSGSTPTAAAGLATTADGRTDSGSVLTPAASRWFEKRGIQAGALQDGSVHSEVLGDSEAIVFPYIRRGVTVNRKHRAPGKKFWMDKGAELVLWNIDCLAANPDHVYIVEGEIDGLSFIQAGFANVVSVPNGAPAGDKTEVLEPEQDEAFRYLWNCRSELAGKRYVLAGDSDEPGIRLREALVARLGRANCDVVEWPEGVKDANEYLVEVGRRGFFEYVTAVRKPYPIRGLSAWDDVTATPATETFDVGVPGLRDHVRLARGTLSVVTGIPGHGKSAVVKQIACEMIRQHGWRVTMASFEDQLYRNLMPEMIRIMSGFAPSPQGHAAVARHEATQVLRARLSFIADEGQVDDDQDIGWFIAMARDAKLRFGTDLLILDPWNEIEHVWGRDRTETQYIGRALRDLRRLAVELDLHVMIVAHPTKTAGDEAPTLYNISGSANFANKVDIGLTVHQPHFGAGPGGPTEVYIRKIKRPDFGRRGMVTLQFDPRSARFDVPGAVAIPDPQDSFWGTGGYE